MCLEDEISTNDLTPFEVFTAEKLYNINERVVTMETSFKIAKILLICVASGLGLDLSGVV